MNPESRSPQSFDAKIVEIETAPEGVRRTRESLTTHLADGEGGLMPHYRTQSGSAQPQEPENKRKNPSKRLRFDVFKRDCFTCQYCGAQPPQTVLVCDHIEPVVNGGKTTIGNLITACEPCNQGKGKHPLTIKAVRPDADLLYLEVQQEILELKRFQQAEKERDALLREIAEDIQDRWMDITGDEYPPTAEVFIQMLRKYSPVVVHEAALITAKKEADGQFNSWRQVTPYLWGVAKRVSDRKEAGEV